MVWTTRELKSEIDSSINYVVPTEDGGYFESRYVRRHPEYFVCYLSSQSGCNRGCAFCHLTATQQTMFQQSNLSEFIAQAIKPISHYYFKVKEQDPARYVHFNWMARGEALCNPTIVNESTELLGKLGDMAKSYDLLPKFNMSTIMPKTFNKSLDETFPLVTPTIYYSLYSVNPDFRNKWLPGAVDVNIALEHLEWYQDYSKKIIKLHYALIEGENDSIEDVRAIVSELKKTSLSVELNLVQYNPPDENSSESKRYNLYLQAFKEEMGEQCRRAKVIQRVGFDVKASCGMFVNG